MTMASKRKMRFQECVIEVEKSSITGESTLQHKYGQEIEVFRDVDELLEKVSYYLSHEEQRLRIAINGYQKVRDHFSYTHQLQQILHTVEEAYT